MAEEKLPVPRKSTNRGDCSPSKTLTIAPDLCIIAISPPARRGILFRGGAEGKIRKGIVEADMLEAVIGLPPNLFSGARIPVAICLLNKAKPAERRDKLLFVDAAQEGCFRQGKARNYLDREHIAQIVETYRTFRDVDRCAHVPDLEEIRDNNFNLNISRYVDTTEPVEVMSVDNALAQLREAERWREEAVARMDSLLAEMGYVR